MKGLFLSHGKVISQRKRAREEKGLLILMAKWNASGREPGEKKMKRTIVIAGKFLMVPFPRSSSAMATTITVWMIGGADWSGLD